MARPLDAPPPMHSPKLLNSQRFARAECVGLGEREARTAKQPQGPERKQQSLCASRLSLRSAWSLGRLRPLRGSAFDLGQPGNEIFDCRFYNHGAIGDLGDIGDALIASPMKFLIDASISVALRSFCGTLWFFKEFRGKCGLNGAC